MINNAFDLSHLRREYRLKSLDISEVASDPFLQFKIWFQEAQQAQVNESNAMCLATASKTGIPSCRIVLLKGIDSQGFLFFSNYQSLKGHNLEENAVACVNFFWPELERQVIIAGTVERLTRGESTAYFSSRPRGSQLGAWASHQSEVVSSREVLEESYKHQEKLFEGQVIITPPYWGGYRLVPERVEFWQGRLNRLHDRLNYRLTNHEWIIERLSP